MTGQILQYLSVYLGSTLKVIIGPVLGMTYGINPLITGALTASGMMTSVYVITFFGTWIRHRVQGYLKRRRRNLFSPKTRRYVKVWQQYGVPGIAFLTPVLFMPIGGALLANAFGGKKSEILKYMWISCIFWGYLLSYLVAFAGDMIPFLDLPER